MVGGREGGGEERRGGGRPHLFVSSEGTFRLHRITTQSSTFNKSQSCTMSSAGPKNITCLSPPTPFGLAELVPKVEVNGTGGKDAPPDGEYKV